MTKKCIGCGTILQDREENNLGYTKNLENELCERCFKLKNYGEYQNVSLTNEDYKKIINNIPSNSLVVYLTSLLNINLDYLNNFNNVLIVLTKRDLLPKSVKDSKLINHIKKHYHNCLDIEIVSAIKNYNLDNLFNKIKKYATTKEVYFIGMTNSGKSTLINKLIEDYSDIDTKITTSMYPSTTLNKVEIKIDDLNIIDTPGLISENSILNKNLNLQDIKKITPKKEIKPRSYQLKENASLLIENMVRIDTKAKDNITIYLANNLNITRLGKENNILKDTYKYEIIIEKNKDLIIEDLCFIKFQKESYVQVFSLYKLNIYTRDNLI